MGDTSSLNDLMALSGSIGNGGDIGMIGSFTKADIAEIVGSVIFGIVGWIAYGYGKQTGAHIFRWTGMVLMIYPYLISGPVLTYVIGLLLCAVLYWSRDY